MSLPVFGTFEKMMFSELLLEGRSKFVHFRCFLCLHSTLKKKRRMPGCLVALIFTLEANCACDLFGEKLSHLRKSLSSMTTCVLVCQKTTRLM